MFRIPIFTYLFLFFISWATSSKIKNQDINKVFRNLLTIAAVLMSIIHLSIFGKESYSLINEGFDLGFIKTSENTKIIGIISIFLYLGITLGEKMFNRFSYIMILILGSIYSTGFIASYKGIEICASIYLIAHTVCSLSISYDVKSGANVIILNSLSYFLISYGMNESFFIIFYFLGVAIHLFALPIFSNSVKTQGYNLRTLAIFQSISTIFIIFLTQALININQNLIFESKNIHLLIGLIGVLIFSYGSFYVMKKKCIVKSLFYSSSFIFGGFLVLTSMAKTQVVQKDIFSLITISSFYLYIMSLTIKAFFRHKDGKFIENSYKVLFIISLFGFANFPIISPSQTILNLSNTSIELNIFTAIFKGFACIIALKFALTFKEQIPNGNIKSKINLDYMHKLIIITSILYSTFYSIFSFNQSISNLIINIFTSSVCVFFGYIILSKYLVNLKQTSSNLIHELIIKTFQIIGAIYESIVIYVASLLDSIFSVTKSNSSIAIKALHEIEIESGSTHKDNFNIQTKNETIVYVIFSLGLIIMIKMFI